MIESFSSPAKVETEIRSEPYSFDELQEKIEEFRDTLFDDSELAEFKSDERYEERYAALWNKKHQEIINELLGQKERFATVFITEKGSTYFQLQSGETLRFKYGLTWVGEKTYGIQPWMQHLFFTDGEIAKFEQDQHENTFTIKFPKSEFREGMAPIEVERLATP